ncbi:MAG: hypothetical protein Kow001_02100 [Acidobacteriota bacterium]
MIPASAANPHDGDVDGVVGAQNTARSRYRGDRGAARPCSLEEVTSIKRLHRGTPPVLREIVPPEEPARPLLRQFDKRQALPENSVFVATGPHRLVA